MLLPKSVLVIGRYSLSVSGNQQVIGSLCQFAVSNWSPLVAKTDEEQRPTLIWAITFQLCTMKRLTAFLSFSFLPVVEVSYKVQKAEGLVQRPHLPEPDLSLAVRVQVEANTD